MAETNDAYTLVSERQHPNELRYADYANKMKSLANQARKEYISTKSHPYSKKAAEMYKDEVAHLNEQLRIAKLKKPRTREAERIASMEVDRKIFNDPDLYYNKKELKKVRQQAIVKARAQVGISKYSIDVSPREWEAIQAGAISNSKLVRIFANTNDEELKKLATPKKKAGLSTAQVSRAKRLLKAGWPQSEVAENLGISVATLKNYVDF